MKKIAYLMILFVATTFVANGQLFVGGSLGFSTTSGSSEFGGTSYDDPTTLSLNFSPTVGYMISDNFWAGIDLTFGMTHSNSNGDPEVVNSGTSIGFEPFLRYYFFRTGKFSLFGQAQAGVAFGSSKSKSGDVTVDGPKETTIGFYVFPGMAFDLSDKIQLQAGINAFSLGFSHSIEKLGDNYDKSTSAGLGVNLNNIVTSGAITIGAIIKL